MPLEELLAMYRYEASIGTAGGSSVGGSSVELTDELPDMTLDKVSKHRVNFVSWTSSSVIFPFTWKSYPTAVKTNC